MNPLNQQLIEACPKGDTDTAQSPLQQDANPNSHANELPPPSKRPSQKTTAKSFPPSSNTSRLSITKSLITQMKLDTNAQTDEGITPFLIATQNGDINMLKLLIRLGADPHTQDAWGQNALHHAIIYRHHPVAQYLITCLQLDPNTQDHYGITPVLLATRKGDIPMLRLLIQLGANPHTTDHRGRNAIHHAVIYRHLPIAQYLITQLNLDPNAQDHQGNTPLHIALENGSIHTAQTLIQCGANPHIPNHQGETPMSIARLHRIRLPKIKPSTITL